MKLRYIFLAAIFSFFIQHSSAQLIEGISLEALQKRMAEHPDTTYFVNFWATWCGPCVVELPYIEQLNQLPATSKVKVLLVSLDFKKGLQEKLQTFIERKNIRSEVIYLTDKDPNVWIPKISKDWSGSIPVTWVVNHDKAVNYFHDEAFESGQPQALLKKLGLL